MKHRKYLKQDKGNNLTFLYFSISRKIQERACEKASYSLSRLRHRYSTRLHRFPLVRPALALTRRQGSMVYHCRTSFFFLTSRPRKKRDGMSMNVKIPAISPPLIRIMIETGAGMFRLNDGHPANLYEFTCVFRQSNGAGTGRQRHGIRIVNSGGNRDGKR
jgi:hypothetical protein